MRKELAYRSSATTTVKYPCGIKLEEILRPLNAIWLAVKRMLRLAGCQRCVLLVSSCTRAGLLLEGKSVERNASWQQKLLVQKICLPF